MKALILAGGDGTRLSEETDVRPKPMVEIGGLPILWHIMKIYSAHGINDFVILLGYKGYQIKNFFANYALRTSDVTFDYRAKTTQYHNEFGEPWKVTLLDTGDGSMTGARVKRAQQYVGNERFCLTYGDGVSDVDITALIAQHDASPAVVTLTSARPAGRFGALAIGEDGKVLDFNEKQDGDGAYINAGFYVCEPDIFQYISDDDSEILEQKPVKAMSAAGKLYTYKHDGFFMPMDTLRDKIKLNELWLSDKPPWKVWD